jgi:hypothetical protein
VLKPAAEAVVVAQAVDLVVVVVVQVQSWRLLMPIKTESFLQVR